MVLFLSIRLVDVSCSADVVELVLSSHRDQWHNYDSYTTTTNSTKLIRCLNKWNWNWKASILIQGCLGGMALCIPNSPCWCCPYYMGPHLAWVDHWPFFCTFLSFDIQMWHEYGKNIPWIHILRIDSPFWSIEASKFFIYRLHNTFITMAIFLGIKTETDKYTLIGSVKACTGTHWPVWISIGQYFKPWWQTFSYSVFWLFQLC